MENVGMPPKLASGKEEDILQGGVRRMTIRDVLKWRAMISIQDDILNTSGLITITWQDDCYLLDRSIWGLIVTPVT